MKSKQSSKVFQFSRISPSFLKCSLLLQPPCCFSSIPDDYCPLCFIYMVVVETSCFPTFNSLFPAQAVLWHLSCGRLLPKQSQGNVFSMDSACLQCPLALTLLVINCLLQVMRGNWLTAPRLFFPLIFCRDQSDSSRSPAKVKVSRVQCWRE